MQDKFSDQIPEENHFSASSTNKQHISWSEFVRTKLDVIGI